uniref:Interleukin-21 receptor-like n=1 Tax=Paramormyrops kingsleyae TaxID=1676925 RepID=A0A3B3RBQ0_9TELE|nr:interleukin-21 receptor-like [Paramormyrops kingsleyae]XP_023647452.1 interleukin-21 receptor-like [Paramormyrops kingsleyae]XP_023647453.1 interleukin-21 receptor-like [Paramormyrops kingsleyae]
MGARVRTIFLTLCGSILLTTWGCQLSCSTDFISSLNCSCTGHLPSDISYYIEAHCWDDLDTVNASCEITSPRPWCILELDYEFNIGSDTECKVWGTPADEWTTSLNSSVYLVLASHVKPQPPFNVLLRENGSNFNISWEMVYTEDKNIYLNNMLMYRIRLRPEDGSSKDPIYYTLIEDQRYMQISCSNLQGGKKFMVDVQAKPSRLFEEKFLNYWSEFSQTLQLHCKKPDDRIYQNWMHLFTPLLLVACACICYLGRKRVWLMKVCVCSYIPSPEDFFKPLYRKHGGDFTKWVGPTFVFGEFDFMEKNMEVVSGKQLCSTVKCEKETEESSSRCGRGGKCSSSGFAANILAQSSSQQNLLEGSNRSQDTLISSGLLSINTVTVIGEESGWDPYRGSCPYPAFRLEENPSKEDEDQLTVEATQRAAISSGHTSGGRRISTELSGQLRLFSLPWNLASSGNEVEQLSLDSFSSAERSEDGYPNVVLDLDTIDSGFLESECSSPVQSDFSNKEDIEDVVISVPQHSRTNYVKQWVNANSAPDTQADV